jgi:type VI secretion system secreted protein Hcp
MKITRTKKILIGLIGLSIYTIPLLTIDGALYMQSHNVKGFEGESKAPGYEGWIEIDSFQIGGDVGVIPPSGGGTARDISAPSLSEMTITKRSDKTSTAFFGGMTQGTPIPELRVFVAPPSNPGRLIKIYLRDVLISGFSWSSGGDFPSESLSFNYVAIKIEYYSTNADGAETLLGSAVWDQATAKAGY